MTRILVTGATGLVGRQVADSLRRAGYEVRAASRRLRIGWEGVEQVGVDLLSCDGPALDALTRDCEILVHLAWETRHGIMWSAPENLDWVVASSRLLQAFHANGGRRFVCVGTCVEYQPPANGPCVPGITPIGPEHFYAVAKDAFHRLLAGFAREKAMEYAWARVFYLIGADEAEPRLVPSLISGLLSGRSVPCSSGRQVRDYMDVRDAGRAIALLATTREATGPFNISTGRPVTIGDVARTVGRLLGKEELVLLGALADRPGEPPNLWGDCGALTRATGFEPQFDVEAAIRNSIDAKKALVAAAEKSGGGPRQG